ncbi:13068_t:CDS:2 [Funneliformis geosporum]|uniref:13068_t:CDS:1 n=1 Tax=Funneliformis geosporum TaxID=1117311 RepID=A0A9W4SV10_9GLOM|nr:13068_t:CDS:2 [Funneliformis geosporum]
MWEISSGYSPFKNLNDTTIYAAIVNNKAYKFNSNQDLIIAITCYKTREISIADTPEDYEKLYKKCWKQKPEQRPIIKEVLKRFFKMGFGKNINDDEIANNESLC